MEVSSRGDNLSMALRVSPAYSHTHLSYSVHPSGTQRSNSLRDSPHGHSENSESQFSHILTFSSSAFTKGEAAFNHSGAENTHPLNLIHKSTEGFSGSQATVGSPPITPQSTAVARLSVNPQSNVGLLGDSQSSVVRSRFMSKLPNKRSIRAPRMRWTSTLHAHFVHAHFVHAVELLGGHENFSPTHEVREGVDVVWQIPPNPQAVLFLAHSGNGTPLSFWPCHPDAPLCKGTPEHKVLVKQALERAFAVIALKSVAEMWEAWPTSSIDIQNAVNILKTWMAEHGLENLPLSAFGTSAGGDFVSSLATVVKMHALVVMISQGHPEAIKSAVGGKYPPTIWVPMIKDERTFANVKEHMATLLAKGIPSIIVEALPFQVHPHFFAEYIDELDEQQSSKLHSVFLEHGIIAEDNYVQRALLEHEAELYLRRAGILPQGDGDRDQEQLDVGKTLNSADVTRDDGLGREGRPGGRGPAGGRHAPPPGQVAGGRHGPPPGQVAGGRHGPPPSKAGRGPPLAGRGGALPNRGSRRPPSNPLAASVSNQLMVAEGRHTLTSRLNAQIFEWLQGKSWSNVS